MVREICSPQHKVASDDIPELPQAEVVRLTWTSAGPMGAGGSGEHPPGRLCQGQHEYDVRDCDTNRSRDVCAPEPRVASDGLPGLPQAEAVRLKWVQQGPTGGCAFDELPPVRRGHSPCD